MSGQSIAFKQGLPTGQNVFDGHRSRGFSIDMQNNVVMVGHYGIGTDINAEDLTQLQNALLNQLAPMFIIDTGYETFTARHAGRSVKLSGSMR